MDISELTNLNLHNYIEIVTIYPVKELSNIVGMSIQPCIRQKITKSTLKTERSIFMSSTEISSTKILPGKELSLSKLHFELKERRSQKK